MHVECRASPAGEHTRGWAGFQPCAVLGLEGITYDLDKFGPAVRLRTYESMLISIPLFLALMAVHQLSLT